MRPFEPLFRNPHLATITANFWPREYDFSEYPMQRRLIQTDADTQVLVQTQFPKGEAVGEVVLLHGLEGGGDAGYCVSTAWHALQCGFVAHRFHMRTCGGTENLCKTLYHAGLTGDLHAFLKQNAAEGRHLPVFLIGYSLGGNVGLKLAGELGETDLIAGACAISTPIDLGASARRIGDPVNFIYERRFVKRMKKRLLATGRYTAETLAPLRSIFDIDDKVTAPSFGFRDAEHYYSTQSAKVFLPNIRVPTLLVQSRDDSYIPFEAFCDPAIAENPMIRLLVTEHGGHLGFLSKTGQRFWMVDAALDFVQEVVGSLTPSAP
ncbi:MAG: alpha/beta hydrolase fold [Bryobacterales bacterium]|jgi:predicted alpha/beta-fold hydrolase|nr:alpha/beta hydrolase fold [Bryobacterales bacterium]